jgi:glutamate-1-semialdehyde 2,1-aminomutase
MALGVQNPSMVDSRTRSEVEAEVIADYRASSPRSAALHEAARRVMPGGDTRTVAFHAPYPLVITQGRGCRVQDADGRTYVDLLNNYTSLIHGHAHSAVVAAVSERLPFGTAFPAPNEAQTRLAQIIVDRVASVDMVRFCNSGSEAVMNALRAARAFTNRDLIVKMEGGYHGTYDDVEVSVRPDPRDPAAGPDRAPTAVLGTRGVPENTIDNVLVTPLNDIEAVERLMRERGTEIAAVIVEPVMGSAGMLPGDQAFVEALRALTLEHEALLIFDEVMSFRLEPGGMQQHYRVRPDLTTFAKIIGGGFPVGGFGGRPYQRSRLSLA